MGDLILEVGTGPTASRYFISSQALGLLSPTFDTLIQKEFPNRLKMHLSSFGVTATLKLPDACDPDAMKLLLQLFHFQSLSIDPKGFEIEED